VQASDSSHCIVASGLRTSSGISGNRQTQSKTEARVMAAEFSEVHTAAIQQMISAVVAAIFCSQQCPVDSPTAPAVTNSPGELG